MTTLPPQFEELADLVWALVNDRLDAAGASRLGELLDADAANRRIYIELMDQFASLEWEKGEGGKERGRANDECRIVNDELSTNVSAGDVHHSSSIDQHSDAPSVGPAIVLDVSPTLQAPLFTLHSPVGSFLFSYTMAALMLGLALLAGWTWKISHEQQVVQDIRPQGHELVTPETQLVGRITGTVDCRWTDPATEVFERDAVSLGRKYALEAGFMEITYHSGAKVILQGPATYEVESANGGFLSLGKLTVRVEAKKGIGSKGERTANLTLSPEEREPTTSLAPRPSPLFSVRTPTAIVTDLGTEFGVEVEKSGTTRSYVFRGRVEVRPTDGRNPPPPFGHGGAEGTVQGGSRAIQLSANESARVEVGRNQAVKVIREPIEPNVFVRRMPAWAPNTLFNTGVGLKEGDRDPHWQVVARSDDPNFKPRAAVVTAVGPPYLANDPAQSQWISLGNGASEVPRGVTLTFRATIDVDERVTLPSNSIFEFQFMSEGRVKAIRVNGRNAPVPKNPLYPDAPAPRPNVFQAARWVHGVNHVEFDVANEAPSHTVGSSPILLRVQWH